MQKEGTAADYSAQTTSRPRLGFVPACEGPLLTSFLPQIRERLKAMGVDTA